MSTIGSTTVELGERVFKMKVLRWLENAILRLAFENTMNASFDYTIFQLL